MFYKRRLNILVLWMSALGFLLGINAGAVAQDSQADMERKKAQVVYNLALFVTWPKSRFSNADSNFRICLLGEAAIALRQAFSELAAQKSIKGHSIEFLQAQAEDNHNACHIAFIGSNVKEKFNELLNELHQSSILTISDRETFAEQGGIIGLLQTGQRVRFGINLDAAEKAKLSIRAQLLVMSGTSLLGKNVPKTANQP